MLRSLILVALAATAIALVSSRPVAAGPISPNNPYRSFNISGINYGSMRWERTHGNRSTASRHAWSPRRGGLFFRRR